MLIYIFIEQLLKKICTNKKDLLSQASLFSIAMKCFFIYNGTL